MRKYNYRQMKMTYPGQRRKYLALFIVLLVAFLAIGYLAKIVPKTSMVVYTDTELYEEQEDYIEIEPYTAEECIDEEYDYTIMNENFYPSLPNYVGTFNVKNNEDDSGEFSFQYNLLTSEGDVILDPKSKTIEGGKSAFFAFVYSPKEDEEVATGKPEAYNIPTKEICETVEKERNVNKTKTVEKYRDVEKQKPETSYVTLFEYLLVK